MNAMPMCTEPWQIVPGLRLYFCVLVYNFNPNLLTPNPFSAFLLQYPYPMRQHSVLHRLEQQ